MDCRIAEEMVSKYINHTLPLNDLEDFLEHIENCSSRCGLCSARCACGLSHFRDPGN